MAIEKPLRAALYRARQQACNNTGKKEGDVSIHIHSHVDYNGNHCVSYNMCSGYGGEQVDVRGVNLSDVVSEFCRRCGYEEQQQLLLTQEQAPVIDGTSDA